MKQKLSTRRKPFPKPPPDDAADVSATTHESVYRALRERILFGGFRPGSAVTLRGLAETLGVSPMPIREAVRRLIAERALSMQGNRRVLVPPMTRTRFQEIVFARLALEPELAARALGNIDKAGISRLSSIDAGIDRAIAAGDVEGYMRGNFDFHFSLYRDAGAEMLTGLAESIWLQFGPFMRTVYGLTGTSRLDDHHQAALAALRARDRRALKAAISADISQGMSCIGATILDARAPLAARLA